MKTDSFDVAMSALRAWYYSEVHSWAEDFDKRIADGEWSDEEDFRESFLQETDSAQLVIHTAQARAACLASDNENAYSEEFGDLPKNDDGSLKWEAMALMAFQRDISEAMTADTNDRKTFTAATKRRARREKRQQQRGRRAGA